MAAPVELKVKVGAVAAALTALLLGALGDVLPSGAVPAWVGTPVLALVTGGVTFGLAWLARHTPRNVIDVANADNSAPPPAAPSAIPPQAGPTP